MLVVKLLSKFKHDHYGLSHSAMLLPVFGAFLSILLVALLSHKLVNDTSYPILIASMGASAVLLFVVPSSPMAKIWPFVGGHLISTAIGISCFFLIPNLYMAVAISVSFSILAMIYLGCLHPPGGAASLAFILAGPEVHEIGFQFLLTPVAMNLFFMLLTSQAFNNARFLIKRRPRVQLAASHNLQSKNTPQSTLPFLETDLDDALKDMETFIDISHEDLNTIFSLALTRAKMRSHQGKSCKDIMTPAHHTIEFGSSLEQAWHLIQDHNLHGLTVVDRGMHVIGIITVIDFLEHAESLDGASPEEKIEALITPSHLLESSKPEAVGQIMSSAVITVNLDDAASSVLPILKKYKTYILPVVDQQKKLQGLICLGDV